MLRIVLWKLGFEWANLKRILSPREEDRIYYFAFGANLSPGIMAERLTRYYEVFDYVLEDNALRFTQSGFYKDHGYASADPAPGEKVYGKMYLISQRDAERMDYYEGVPFLNSHEKVFQQHEGKTFYYYRARTQTENLKPTQEYLDYLTTAYRDMDCVPADYIEAMAATEVLDYFEPQNLTGKFIDDINRWPKILHPLLVKYESRCRQLVRILWNSSLLVWMIKA
ncbi:MAG: gamma-glutamylcyclotransferase family protein [Thiolinea sp.]